MARTKYVQSIVASASNAADATTRGTIDVRERDGGILTLRMTNGATGPTVPCTARVMIAHNTGATPTAAAPGTDWKTVETFTGAVTANAVVPRVFTFPPAVMHIQVEFAGNTAQAVTVEAIASTIDYSA
jgi:hypothetical protein